MGVTMTSIRLDTDLADEAVKSSRRKIPHRGRTRRPS